MLSVHKKITPKPLNYKLFEVESGSITVGDVKGKYGIQSHGTVLGWFRKFGSFDWENQTTMKMPKSPQQKLMELEQKVLLLEKQKARFLKQVEQADKKAIIFDIMIDLAEREYNIPIRKKLVTRSVKEFQREHQQSISSACRLLGVNRQVYYRSIKSTNNRKEVSNKVVQLVKEVRRRMPRICTRKLHYF